MGTKVYVGNLSKETTAAELEGLFNQAGLVLSVLIATDPKTGVSKKYGYVSMTAEGCEAAVKTLNGSMLNGHQLSVSPAARED